MPALTIVIQSWATPIVGLLMLLIGAALGFWARPLVNPTSTPTVVAAAPLAATSAPTQAGEEQSLMEIVLSQTRHFLGNADAPVTLIEFSDFQWPYCGVYATGAGRQITEQYVENGLVRVGYIHFTFLGTESVRAAEASECADEQGAFWPYHDLLFESQSGENQGGFEDQNLVKLAETLNLNVDQFSNCLESGKYSQVVQQETSFSQSIGVSSTPSFVLNGQPVVGAQPFEDFQQLIEAELGR